MAHVMEEARSFKERVLMKTKLLDSLFLIGLVLIYSIAAFINLGDDIAPQTFYRFKDNSSIAILLPKKVRHPNLMFYVGISQNDFRLSYEILSAERTAIIYDNELKEINASELLKETEARIDGPFRWRNITVDGTTSLVVLNNVAGRDIDFGEMAVYDGDEKVEAKFYYYEHGGSVFQEDELSLLSDEPETIQTEESVLNSTYFDELYFAQTAYQYATGQYGYETVHPPLGKILQSIPIVITGRMTPFTWRMAGTVTGILIIIATYFLAKQIFKKASYARIAAILVALSGLHFVQTRVGTVDSYLCLFTILAYLFMLRFIDIKENGGGKFRDFLLSGFFFGCCFAVKWSGAFGGIGLAILFFWNLTRTKVWHADFNFVEFLQNLREKKFLRWFFNGILCFVFIPIVIYCACYLLFPQTTGAHDLDDVYQQGSYLFSYHSNEHTPHPYSSKWYTWPIALKPMLYSWCNGGESRLYLMGNYVVAYVSVVAIIVSMYFVWKKKDEKSIHIVLAWLSLWIPYAFISRTMFLYHYLPASVFAILAIINMFYQLPGIRKIIPLYILAAVIAFIVSYPQMVGL